MFRVLKLSPSKFNQLLPSQFSCVFLQRKLHVVQTSRRLEYKSIEKADTNDTVTKWPRKIFSGIQPTGTMHLGNYLGAVHKWIDLQNKKEDMTICIVDMHSITMPHNPPELRENIFKMAAMLLACGIDPAQTTLFVQSSVLEHCEFNWILNCMVTMPRLAQLPQFKDKSRKLRDIPLGLYVYPVLQAADIMLYKATHVPVGQDQLQHIQLAQHLAKSFNHRYGEMFPICHAMIDNDVASRVRSLRDPSHKMSKSDLNTKSTIFLNDGPQVVIEKIKKAVTDFNSDISYNPTSRPGVSNLVAIHSLVTGLPIAEIVDDAKTIDTGKYKLRVAEAVNAHLKPIHEQYNHHLARRNELIYMLEIGAEKARQIAQLTMNVVKQRYGLGTYLNMPEPVEIAETLPEKKSKMTASQKLTHRPFNASSGGVASQRHSSDIKINSSQAANEGKEEDAAEVAENEESTEKSSVYSYKPIVPIQKMRIEKAVGLVPPEIKFNQYQRTINALPYRSNISSVYTCISSQGTRTTSARAVAAAAAVTAQITANQRTIQNMDSAGSNSGSGSSKSSVGSGSYLSRAATITPPKPMPQKKTLIRCSTPVVKTNKKITDIGGATNVNSNPKPNVDGNSNANLVNASGNPSSNANMNTDTNPNTNTNTSTNINTNANAIANVKTMSERQNSVQPLHSDDDTQSSSDTKKGDAENGAVTKVEC